MLFCTIPHKLNINIIQTNPETKKEPTTKINCQCLFGKPVWHICTFHQTIIHGNFFKLSDWYVLLLLYQQFLQALYLSWTSLNLEMLKKILVQIQVTDFLL